MSSHDLRRPSDGDLKSAYHGGHDVADPDATLSRGRVMWQTLGLSPRVNRSIQEEAAMPESVPSSLIIDTFKEIFQAERRGGARQDPLGWIISVPDTHQKTVLAALDKERSLRVITCSTEADANPAAAGLYQPREP